MNTFILAFSLASQTVTSVAPATVTTIAPTVIVGHAPTTRSLDVPEAFSSCGAWTDSAVGGQYRVCKPR